MNWKAVLTALIFLLSQFIVSAQVHLGVGGNYALPAGQFNKMNSDSPGISLLLESRKYCNLWYGIKLDYLFLEKNQQTDTTYFTNAFIFSPEFRYVFTYGNCSNPGINFYAQGLLNISSIGGSDQANRLGLGGSLGAGASMPYVFLKKCWALDMNISYAAPNFIFRAENRMQIQYIMISLFMSIGL